MKTMTKIKAILVTAVTLDRTNDVGAISFCSVVKIDSKGVVKPLAQSGEPAKAACTAAWDRG